MLKNVIKEFQQKPLGYLTVICARPGDGRRTFTIELANHLAMQGIPVCYCSITQTKNNLENKLIPAVHILSGCLQDGNYVLKRLTESARVRGAVVLIDEFSLFALQEELKETTAGTYEKTRVKTELLLKIKEIAMQRGIHIVVTDTFSHSSDTDDMLPLSKDALKLCDRAYILYKNNVTADTPCYADATMLKLKEIEI